VHPSTGVLPTTKHLCMDHHHQYQDVEA